MKGLFKRIALTLASVAIGVGLATAPARPQFTASSGGGAVTTQIVNSTAPTGTSSVLALDGLYSNCTVFAAVTAGTTSITVYGNGQQGQYGPGSPSVTNPNFGTAGVISVSSAAIVATAGNVANLPVGLYFTWSGNTGTLSAWATCTSAIAKRSGGGGGPTPSPVPTAAFGPLFASTGLTNQTTPAGAGVWAIAPCGTGAVNCAGGTISFTTGTSLAPNGLWFITVIAYESTNAAFSGNGISQCVTSTSAITLLDGATNGAVGTCANTTLTNAFMGGPAFGSTGNPSGLAQTLIAHLTLANATLFSANCNISSAAGAATLYGYCTAVGQMY